MIEPADKLECPLITKFGSNNEMSVYLSNRLKKLGAKNENAKKFVSLFLRPFWERPTFKEALLEPNELVNSARTMTQGKLVIIW